MRALRMCIAAAVVVAGIGTALAQPAGSDGAPVAGTTGSASTAPQTTVSGSAVAAPPVTPVNQSPAPAAAPGNPGVGSGGVAAAPTSGSAAGSAAPAAAGSGAGSGSASRPPPIVEINCASAPADTLTVTTEGGAFNPPALEVASGGVVKFTLTGDNVEAYPGAKYPQLRAAANATTCLRFDAADEYKYHSTTGHPIEGAIYVRPWYDILANKQVIQGGNFWMPESVNIEADDSDFMFYSVLGLSIFFFFAIAVAVIYLTIKYRHRPGHKAEPSAAHNDALEITWTVIPTIITVFLFYYGWHAYIKVVTPPTKAVEIQVTAKRWAWNFTHSNGVTDSDLHLPIDQPVRFVMTSQDVLHSFYIPVMRIKQDIVPRRYTYAWLHAKKAGTYRLNCAEYCGTDHSQMGHTGPILPEWPEGRRAVVVVHEAGGYEKYLSDKSAESNADAPEVLGKKLYEKKGCINCHTIDGTAKIGPSWKQPDWGKMIDLAGGTQVKMDENYVRESILVPAAKARPGYPNSMPSFEGQLKPNELEALIAFIKSLKQP